MELLMLAAQHEIAFKLAAVVIAALAMTLFLAFPVKHKDETLLGDGGLGLAAAFVRQWGWIRALMIYGAVALGVALFFLPMLGGAT